MASTLLDGADAAPAEASPVEPVESADGASVANANQGGNAPEEHADSAPASEAREDGQTQSGSEPGGPDVADEAPGDSAEAEGEYAHLELPEGSPLDPAQLDAVREFAKANSLTAEAASALLEREHQRASEVVESWVTRTKSWEAEVRADKEMGGENLDATIQSAKTALSKYWDPDFARELSESGMGNHPGLIRGLARLGRAMAEPSSFARGEQPASRTEAAPFYKKSPEMYGD